MSPTGDDEAVAHLDAVAGRSRDDAALVTSLLEAAADADERRISICLPTAEQELVGIARRDASPTWRSAPARSSTPWPSTSRTAVVASTHRSIAPASRHHPVPNATDRTLLDLDRRWMTGRCLALWQPGPAAFPAAPKATRQLDDPALVPALADAAGRLGTYTL